MPNNNNILFEHPLIMPEWFKWVPFVIPVGLFIAVVDTGAEFIIGFAIVMIGIVWGALLFWMLHALIKKGKKHRTFTISKDGVLACKFLKPREIDLKQVKRFSISPFLASQKLEFVTSDGSVITWQVSPRVKGEKLERFKELVQKFILK